MINIKDIKLLEKKIIWDKSPVIFSYQPDENWEKHFFPITGKWKYEDGYLIGEEKGNLGGILLTKEYFKENVMFSFTIGTCLPS